MSSDSDSSSGRGYSYSSTSDDTDSSSDHNPRTAASAWHHNTYTDYRNTSSTQEQAYHGNHGLDSDSVEDSSTESTARTPSSGRITPEPAAPGDLDNSDVEPLYLLDPTESDDNRSSFTFIRSSRTAMLT